MVVAQTRKNLGRYTYLMSQVTLPDALDQLLGDDAEREVLEGVLLKLVSEGRTTLARAAELLSLSREEALRWYTRHGLSYPNLDDEELERELAFARDYPHRGL